MKCKKCGVELVKMIDYTGKKLCRKCYQHQYDVDRWKNNPKYRQAQVERIKKWAKENPERVKQYCINRKNRKTK